MHLVRPQIINGGQTAYTLSRIYSEDKQDAEERFAGKEVLTKIITLTAKDTSKETSAERLSLIDEISAASNRQTPVINADRVSNDLMYTKLQGILFERYGVLFERKRGEFNDGVVANYINRSQILERNLFFRIFFASQGRLNLSRKKRIFLQHNVRLEDLTSNAFLDVFAEGYDLFKVLAPRRAIDQQNANRYRDVLAKVFIGVRKADGHAPIEIRASLVEVLWEQLLTQVAQYRAYAQMSHEAGTGKRRSYFSADRWMNSADFERDMHDFVSNGKIKDRRPLINEELQIEFRELLEEAKDKRDEETTVAVGSSEGSPPA